MQVLKTILLPFLLEGFNLISYKNSLSVSAAPSRVCLCDGEGVPQCADKLSSIFMSREVYPGETITISVVVVVGGDFGATVGTVYAGFLADHSIPLLKPDTQSSQVISNPRCTDLSYTLHGDEGSSAVMHLSTLSCEQFESKYRNKDDIKRALTSYHDKQTILSVSLLTTPVFIDINFLHCPPGFSPAKDPPPDCECDSVLSNLIPNIDCEIRDGSVSFAWTGKVWIGVDDNTNGTISIGLFCPYCSGMPKLVNILNKSDFDTQCEYGRDGRLCGRCKEGYSLAIGSSHCLQCSNNNLALVIFFAAVGFLLILFISILNLTVSQGMINGLIFYANVVWSYQGIIVPNEDVPFIKVFLAWLNLDFGIQTCFSNHLTAIVKTWLQFVFPFYIAGLFLIGLHISRKLSRLFGE